MYRYFTTFQALTLACFLQQSQYNLRNAEVRLEVKQNSWSKQNCCRLTPTRARGYMFSIPFILTIFRMVQ
jgi:hypothetical protein